MEQWGKEGLEKPKSPYFAKSGVIIGGKKAIDLNASCKPHFQDGVKGSFIKLA